MSKLLYKGATPPEVTTVGLSADPKVALSELRAQLRAYKQHQNPDVPEDTAYTLEYLLALERDNPKSTACPTSLPLGEILRASRVFQPRLSSASDWISESLIKDIARHIKSSITEGTAPNVEPLLVTSIGGKWFVVDGHHRHAGYLNAHRGTPCAYEIPVRVHQGDVRSARNQAMRENVCGKIPMDSRSRSEFTWGLVKEGLKHSEIREVTQTSLRNIGIMAKALRDKPEFAEFTWVDVKRGHKLTEDEKAAFGDDHKQAEKLSRELRTKMGAGFPYSPRILAMALRMINDGLPEKLLSEWSSRYQVEEDAELLGI